MMGLERSKMRKDHMLQIPWQHTKAKGNMISTLCCVHDESFTVLC